MMSVNVYFPNLTCKHSNVLPRVKLRSVTIARSIKGHNVKSPPSHLQEFLFLCRTMIAWLGLYCHFCNVSVPLSWWRSAYKIPFIIVYQMKDTT